MRRLILPFLSTGLVALASRRVFSVHDDLLAYPQFEIIFSDDLITDSHASALLSQSSPSSSPVPATDKGIEQPHLHHGSSQARPNTTHELLRLNTHPHLCTLPHVPSVIPANESSTNEARLATQKELARASVRGWELLSPLSGNCLYFISGWWSYQFCYNGEVTQFHQLGPHSVRGAFPPQRDPTTPEFTLGKVRASAREGDSEEDEWGNRIAAPKSAMVRDSGGKDLQTKGNARYLVQKMDGGSICDLTGRPRQVEVQYHCMPRVKDRIGYIKEVTTCSYLLVIHTERLCDDVAFLPPREEEAVKVVCRRIVREAEEGARGIEDRAAGSSKTEEAKATIGGITLGGAEFVGREGQRMPIPWNFGQEDLVNPGVETIAVRKSQADGGQIQMISEDEMEALDIDPAIVEELRQEVQDLAQERGWKIEIMENPGEIRELLAIVDTDGEEEESMEDMLSELKAADERDERGEQEDPHKDPHAGQEDDKKEKGSEEEYYKDEL